MRAREQTRTRGRPPIADADPLWYKRGVIYELHVRAFQDSDADGAGDFRGLTSRIEFLRDLGITAVWLLPFYPSPLKDDGYDISDYFNVHPMYGTLADFKLFLREAHWQGLKVITELVLNHTSDQHHWFQRARRAKPGSQWRDYYVWSDTAEKYKGTRIIFKDTENSNWSWDPVANAYYWHRFYAHQPDLNFDNPAVHQEMLKVLDFWFDLGVDGVRLDAVPYLYEREGTSCENLPETHEFLRRLRAHVDERHSNRMLLAEANQWPDDAVAYFGASPGNECHMAFHFPLMPRLFMSLRMEDRVPIVDILQQTPAIPETAQWALFLRNHDELTLEMVTDEERDYMYRMYAHLYQARLNLGIRRRLSPLLGNDRKRIELLNALLFSLPGTPVIYYGDEIGMGENIYLGDRNGVRTPMQWSADRNAGFSRATPHRLYLPINIDPENHYEAVNVEVQQRNPYSLLWWTKRMITLRKRWSAFGLGTIEFLHPDNRKVFACLRRYQQEIILVVANLSRFVQPVELDLAGYKGLTPVELFGRTEFPVITEKPYSLTVGPHGFYWFALEACTPMTSEAQTPAAAGPEPPLLRVAHEWDEVFQPQHQTTLEQALLDWLGSRRWFGGKRKIVTGIHVREKIPISLENDHAIIALVEVEYAQSEPDTYALPLAYAVSEAAQTILNERARLVLARVAVSGSEAEGVVFDALVDKAFCKELLALIATHRTVRTDRGMLETSHTAVLRKLRAERALSLEPSISKAEQSNSSVIFGERLILKFFRRIEVGVNPDLELGRFLTARRFPWAPALAGAIEYRNASKDLLSVAMLTSLVPKSRDLWQFTLDALSRFYERVQALPHEQSIAPASGRPLLAMADSDLPDQAKDMIGTYAETARILGVRTAELHLALASDSEDRNFAPEPFTPHYQRGLSQSMRNLMRQSFQLLERNLKSLSQEAQLEASDVLASEPEILKRLQAIYEHPIQALRTRFHGDYHLGQVLYDGKDFWIIDFEGEPAGPLSARRLKHSPLQDVADMIRSFHHAAYEGLLKQVESGALPPAQVAAVGPWARFWSRWVSALFLKAYRFAVGQAPFMPSEKGLAVLLDAYLLRKAISELAYELNNRPTRVSIPLQGILDLINQQGTP